MHDIDSTRLEFNPQNEASYEAEAEAEANHDIGEAEHDLPMSEAEEEAFAAELLGVSSEAEMDQFLGGLFRSITQKLGRGAARFLGKDAGPLAQILKGVAGRALPFLGGVLGSAIPIPGVGTAVGAAVGNAASKLVQSETEHLEAEEQEFQQARRFVRLAGTAARRAAWRPLASNPVASANLALRQVLQSWRRSGGYSSWGSQPSYGGAYGYGRAGWRPRYRGWRRYYGQPGYYRACPPCPEPPPCPVCPEPPPAGVAVTDAAAATDSAALPPPPPATPSGEMDEFGYANEGEEEAEYYETNYNPPNNLSGEGNRSGRWVRRGGKIVLFGL